jgi:hypothetical protein
VVVDEPAGPDACEAGVPHSSQNFWPGVNGLPHLAQAAPTGVPHSAQNFAVGESSDAHFAHAINVVPRSRQDSSCLRVVLRLPHPSRK